MLQQDGSLDPIAVYTILEETAIDMEAPGFDFDSGHGLVDGFAALQAVGMPMESPTPTTMPTESLIPTTMPTDIPTTGMATEMPSSLPSESPIPSMMPTEMPDPLSTESPIPSTMPTVMPVEMPNPTTMPTDDGPCVGPLTVGRLFFSFDFFLCLFSVIAQSIQGLFSSAP